MSLFPTVAIQVLRSSPGSYVGGHWEDGSPSVFTILGSVHPASGQRLQALPEGDRATEGYEIYTDQALIPSDPATQTKADQVCFSAWDGLGLSGGDQMIDNAQNLISLSMSWPFKIVWSKQWNNGIIPHCEAIAIRIKEGGTP